MGWFVFLERYVHRLDGISLSAAVILYFSVSPENVALFYIRVLLKGFLSKSKHRALPETG